MRDRFRDGWLLLILRDGHIHYRSAVHAFPGIAHQEVVRKLFSDHQTTTLAAGHRATSSPVNGEDIQSDEEQCKCPN